MGGKGVAPHVVEVPRGVCPDQGLEPISGPPCPQRLLHVNPSGRGIGPRGFGGPFLQTRALLKHPRGGEGHFPLSKNHSLTREKSQSVTNPRGGGSNGAAEVTL